jgi:hypothetical protein
MLQVDRSKRETQTLAVLKRMDPDVETILGSATHVVAYCYKHHAAAAGSDSDEDETAAAANAGGLGWARAEVEGPLFLAKLSGGRFRMVVMNRLSMTNLTQDIAEGFEVT